MVIHIHIFLTVFPQHVDPSSPDNGSQKIKKYHSPKLVIIIKIWVITEMALKLEKFEDIYTYNK